MFKPKSRLNIRVLVMAPTGRDGRLISATLEKQNIVSEPFDGICDFCMELRKGAGVAVLTEEALIGENLVCFSDALVSQAPWSDLPVIILTTGYGGDNRSGWDLISRLDPVGNVSLLERPLRSLTLVKAVQVALRARRRQYELKALNETLEARVHDRTAELERLNREAEGFNYSISHDLRAPLRAIVGTSQMLLQDCSRDLTDEARQHLRRQSEAASRLATLIDELLRLSRLSHQEMQLRDFDLSRLAVEIVGELEGGRMSNHCEFDIKDGLKAFGDPSLIRFVLMNLFSNACKFSPHGGTITLGKDPNGAFFVRDEGIGFDMQYLDKIFLPFERLVTDTEFPGTGIGLANVKRIIERHRGNIWAESEPGKGATFFFILDHLTDS